MSKISERPLLTLAIPTFNRLDCLRLLIESIIRQIPSEGVLGETFELLICNNASTDGTTEYLNGLVNIQGIRVIHHPENCGGTNNCIHCFEAATGKYVWLMGDDDIPLNGAIMAVLECLERDQPDILYLRSKGIRGDLRKQADNLIPSNELIALNSMSLAARSSVLIAFISPWVLNKDVYLSLEDVRIDRYRDTSLPHLEWILTLIKQGRKLLISKDIWLIARTGNTGGWPLFDVFPIEYNCIVDEMLLERPPLRRFFRRCMLWRFIPRLVWDARQNTVGTFEKFDKDKVMRILKQAYGNDTFFMFFVVPIIKFNRPIAWCFCFMARVFAKLWPYWWQKRPLFGSLRNEM
jgi:glycosyltransferase involved in cell wall biosynthesis